jgi:hypothetical protein
MDSYGTYSFCSNSYDANNIALHLGILRSHRRQVYNFDPSFNSGKLQTSCPAGIWCIRDQSVKTVSGVGVNGTLVTQTDEVSSGPQNADIPWPAP